MAYNSVRILRGGLHEKARRAASIGTAMPGDQPNTWLTPSRIADFVYCPESQRLAAQGHNPDTESRRAGTADHDRLARRIEAGNNTVALRVLLGLLAIAAIIVALLVWGSV